MMNTGNYQKTPLGQSLARISREAVATALQQTGKGLPCTVVAVSGQFVTVNFEIAGGPFTLPNITIPITTSRYDWIPVQIGDTGMTVAADVYLGGVTGQGGGVAPLVQRLNLTALAFQPLPKVVWTVPNANQRVVQGPAGALVQTLDGKNSINLVSGSITISIGGSQVMEITSAGVAITGTLTATGEITAGQGGGDQVGLQTHLTTGVSGGTGTSGPPKAGT